MADDAPDFQVWCIYIELEDQTCVEGIYIQICPMYVNLFPFQRNPLVKFTHPEFHLPTMVDLGAVHEANWPLGTGNPSGLVD